MRLNENTRIVSSKVVLVPYEKKHVPKYHKWMQDEELQRLTASEPLTLEEEYEMQRKWREDADKLTFIVLDKESVNAGADEVESMVGDVNIFLQKLPKRNSPSDDECGDTETEEETVAEVEVMIAETSARNKGLASQAICLIIQYCHQHLQVTRYMAKIADDNAASIYMFGKLHFRTTGHNVVFQEHTLEWDWDEAATDEAQTVNSGSTAAQKVDDTTSTEHIDKCKHFHIEFVCMPYP